jgi:hypothetical protein
MLALIGIGIIIVLRDYFWHPKILWFGRMAFRVSLVGILSILFHGWMESGMTWRLSVEMILCVMFLCESIYVWWVTGIMQKQQLPVILHYEMPREMISWPAHRHFRRLRDYFRQERFRMVGTFQISFFDVPLMRNVVMLDASQRIRLEIFFRMGAKGIHQVQFALSSRVKENEWIVTDNLNLPSGGPVPKEWKLRRYRFASHKTLLQRHRRYLQVLGSVCETWDGQHILDELNREQERLAMENFQQGLLEKSSDGRQYILSDEGRYRLWKSTLSLYYLGIA